MIKYGHAASSIAVSLSTYEAAMLAHQHGIISCLTTHVFLQLTHGFVLDERGIKMSKSIGNVVDPRGVIEGGKDQKKEPAYGADVLRLWVSSVDYTNDVLIGGNILSQVCRAARKLIM